MAKLLKNNEDGKFNLELFYHTTKEFFKKKKKEREEKEKAEEENETEGKGSTKTFMGYLFSWNFFFQILLVVAILSAFYFLNKHTGVFGSIFHKHFKEK